MDLPQVPAVPVEYDKSLVCGKSRINLSRRDSETERADQPDWQSGNLDGALSGLAGRHCNMATQL